MFSRFALACFSASMLALACSSEETSSGAASGTGGQSASAGGSSGSGNSAGQMPGGTSGAGPAGGQSGSGGRGAAGTAAGGSADSGGASAGGAGANSGGSGGTSGSPGDGGIHPIDECTLGNPDWIFCSGFEEGNKSIWDDYDGNADTENQLIADPGPLALTGNHVVRLRVPAGRGGSDLVKLLPPHDRLYARWYVYYEPGFDFAAPNHGSALFAGDRNNVGRSGIRPDGTDMVSLGVEHSDRMILNTYVYYRGMYQDCVDPNGSCWGDSLPCVWDQGQSYCTVAGDRPGAGVTPPALATGRWYCVETFMDGGTPSSSESGATGVLDWWVDGVEMGPFNGRWLRTTADLKVSVLWLSLFHHADHSVEGVYYDNVVASTSRVGCL